VVYIDELATGESEPSSGEYDEADGCAVDDKNPLWRAIAGVDLSPPTNSLADLIACTPPPSFGSGLGSFLGTVQTKRRRVFFAFHYADILRVNNVRLSGEFTKSASESGREVEGFYDNSLWESRKRSGDDTIRNLIRDGVKNSSAVCVLVGTGTWSRPWVRYEIARAVIDGRGILAVHINGLKHHLLGVSHALGTNPLEFLGVYKTVQPGVLSSPKYYIYERKTVWNGYQNVFEWHPYDQYTHPVDRPQWLAAPLPGYVMPLSANATVYDYVGGVGHKNIGGWIDAAAIAAGR
jgi:hypothetical protein